MTLTIKKPLVLDDGLPRQLPDDVFTAGVRRTVHGSIENDGDEVVLPLSDNLEIVAKYNTGPSPAEGDAKVWMQIRSTSGTQSIDLRKTALYGDDSVWADYGDAIEVSESGYNYGYNTLANSSENFQMQLRTPGGTVWEIEHLISGGGLRVSLTAQPW